MGARRMMARMRICIEFGSLSLKATLRHTQTGLLLREKLPFSSRANRWGDEIYFAIPVVAELEEGAGDVVERGDIGFWPPGRAMALFFGPTPASLGQECRAASPVNVVGRMDGDFSQLDKVRPGEQVVIRLDEGNA